MCIVYSLTFVVIIQTKFFRIINVYKFIVQYYYIIIIYYFIKS